MQGAGVAAAAILTLALGTGATAAVFTLVDAVVLRPLVGASRTGSASCGPFRPRAPAPGCRTRSWTSSSKISGLAAVAGLMDLRLNLLVNGANQELQALAAVESA